MHLIISVSILPSAQGTLPCDCHSVNFYLLRLDLKKPKIYASQ